MVENEKELVRLATIAVEEFCKNGARKGRNDDYEWNPLYYDEDAFDAAVTLGMSVNVCDKSYSVTVDFYTDDVFGTVTQSFDEDKYLAVRVAITEAAATIGEVIERAGEDEDESVSHVSDEQGKCPLCGCKDLHASPSCTQPSPDHSEIIEAINKHVSELMDGIKTEIMDVIKNGGANG